MCDLGSKIKDYFACKRRRNMWVYGFIARSRVQLIRRTNAVFQLFRIPLRVLYKVNLNQDFNNAVFPAAQKALDNFYVDRLSEENTPSSFLVTAGAVAEHFPVCVNLACHRAGAACLAKPHNDAVIDFLNLYGNDLPQKCCIVRSCFAVRRLLSECLHTFKRILPFGTAGTAAFDQRDVFLRGICFCRTQ